MAEDVLCEVENCVYWKRGNRCEAPEIYIVSNVSRPETTEETDCETFEPAY